MISEVKMSQSRASILPQVHSSQMFGQEVLYLQRETPPPGRPPSSLQAAVSISAFPTHSTNFSRSPDPPPPTPSKEAQRVEGIPTHTAWQEAHCPFTPLELARLCRSLQAVQSKGSAALGRLRSGFCSSPSGSQGAVMHSRRGHLVPGDIYHTSTVCQNRKCPLASSAPTLSLTPWPTAFGRWGKPGPPKNRQNSLSHPHPSM